jgi:hypothetical protein
MKKITLLAILLTTIFSFGQITDGGFEGLPTGDLTRTTLPWSTSVQPATGGSLTKIVNNPLLAHTGDYYAQMENDFRNLRQYITVTAGVEYTVSFWYQSFNDGIDPADGLWAQIRINDGTSNGTGSLLPVPISHYAVPPLTAVWAKYSFTFTTTTETAIVVSFYKNTRKSGGANINNSCRIDDVSLVPTSSLAVKYFAQFSFKSYPNPATNQLNLSANKTIDSVSFYNVLGQKVQSNAVNATNKQIDISNFKNGVYMMEVTIDNVKQTYKIMKK